MATVDQNGYDGGQALVKALENEGIEYVFGLSGGAALPIFDALVSTENKMKFVLVRHEQGGSHMADGYARATGKPAVVLVTSGPGATNTLTGIMTAHMDSVPMLVVTGQQVTGMLGKDAFQEADIFGITMPIVKHSYLVKDTDAIPRIVREAYHIATTGTAPGPVLIDVPKDVSQAPMGNGAYERMDIPGYEIPEEGDREVIVQAAAALNAARRAGAPGGPRCPHRQGLRLGAALGGAPAGAGHHHPAGQGGVPGEPPAVAGDARHARHRLRQQGDGGVRPGDVDRLPLRRPHHRPAAPLLPQRDGDSRRHRSRRERQDDQARPLHSGRRAAGGGGVDQARHPARHRRLAGARLDRYKVKFPLKYRKQGGLKMQHIIDELYRLTEGKGDRLHRRGPASDVGGAVLQDRLPRELAQLRRRRHHGLRLPGGHRRPVRAARRPGAGDRRRRRLSDDAVRAGHGVHPQACRSR